MRGSTAKPPFPPQRFPLALPIQLLEMTYPASPTAISPLCKSSCFAIASRYVLSPKREVLRRVSYIPRACLDLDVRCWSASYLGIILTNIQGTFRLGDRYKCTECAGVRDASEVPWAELAKSLVETVMFEGCIWRFWLRIREPDTT